MIHFIFICLLVSRLAAIQALSYRMINLTAGQNTSNDGSGGSNGSGERLNVTYNGSVDKTKVEETVDCIPRDILLNVLEGIHASNQEALRYVVVCFIILQFVV